MQTKFSLVIKDATSSTIKWHDFYQEAQNAVELQFENLNQLVFLKNNQCYEIPNCVIVVSEAGKLKNFEESHSSTKFFLGKNYFCILRNCAV